MPRDHVLQQHRPARHWHESRQERRHRHDAVPQACARARGEPDDEVQRLVAQMGKRVGGVERQGSEHRQDLLLEKIRHHRGRFGREIRTAEEAHAGAFETGQHLFTEDTVLPFDQLVAPARDGLQLLGWRHRVRTGVGHVPGELLLQPRDADHEEFVEADAQDGEKAEPLQKRELRIARFFEHALEECERRELAVDEMSRITRHGLWRIARVAQRGRGIHRADGRASINT